MHHTIFATKYYVIITMYKYLFTPIFMKNGWYERFYEYWYGMMLNWNRNFLRLDFQVVSGLVLIKLPWLNVYTELNSLIIKYAHFENYFSFTIIFEIHHIDFHFQACLYFFKKSQFLSAHSKIGARFTHKELKFISVCWIFYVEFVTWNLNLKWFPICIFDGTIFTLVHATHV